MEKILEVQEILESIREDEQQLEKLITDLKREEEPSASTAGRLQSPHQGLSPITGSWGISEGVSEQATEF